MAQKHPNDHADFFDVTKDEKQFSLLKVPSRSDSLVISQIEEINDNLPLETLAESLSSLALFIRLASCAVKGHADLEIKVRKILKSVTKLCDETVHTLNDFKRSCNASLKNLSTAYGYLKDGLEDQAISLLKRLKETSEKMIKRSSDLTKLCEKQVHEIEEVGSDTMIKKAEIIGSIEEQEKIIKDSENESEINKKQSKSADEEATSVQQKSREAKKKQEEAHKDSLKVLNEKESKLKQINQNLDEKKSQIQKDYSEKEKELNDLLVKTMEAAQSEYKKAIEESQMIFEKSMKATQVTHVATMQQNKQEFDKKMQSNQDTYNTTKQNVMDTYEKCIQQNRETYDCEIQSNEKEYEDAKESCEKVYRDSINQNAENSKAELIQNQQNLDDRLKQNEDELNLSITNHDLEYEKKLQDMENDPNLHVPEAVSLSDLEAEIKRDYDQQLKENEEKYISLKNQIERDYSEKLSSRTSELDSQLSKIDSEQRNDDKYVKRAVDEVQMPEGPGFLQSINPIGKGERRQKYEAKMDDAKAQKRGLQDEYGARSRERNARRESARNIRDSAISDLRSERSRKIDDLEQQRIKWDNEARTSKDSAITKAKRDKETTDKKIASVNQLRHNFKAKVNTKKLENNKNAQKTKLNNDALGKRHKNDADKMVKTEKARLDKEAYTIKMQCIDKANKVKQEANTKAESKKAKADELAYSQKEKDIQDALNILQLSNEQAKSQKENADAAANQIKCEANEATEKAKKGRDDQAEDTRKIKTDEYNLNMNKQLEAAASLLQEQLEDLNKTADKEKQEVEQSAEEILNIQKQEWEKWLKNEREFETKAEEMKKKKEIHDIKMAEAALRIQKAVNQKKIQGSAKECLDEAITALRSIEDTMSAAYNFWNEMKSFCEGADESLIQQLECISLNDDADKRRLIWSSDTFKQQALGFYAEWAALEEVCSEASKAIKYVKVDVHRYVRENPSDSEAKVLVEKLSEEFVKKVPAITDKETELNDE